MQVHNGHSWELSVFSVYPLEHVSMQWTIFGHVNITDIKLGVLVVIGGGGLRGIMHLHCGQPVAYFCESIWYPYLHVLMHLVTSLHGAGVGGGGVSGIRRSVLGFGVVGTCKHLQTGHPSFSFSGPS